MKTDKLITAACAIDRLTKSVERIIRKEERLTGLRFDVNRSATPASLPVNCNTTIVGTKVEGLRIEG